MKKNLLWQYVQPVIIPYLILALALIPDLFINPFSLGTKPWDIWVYIPMAFGFIYYFFIGLIYCPLHIPATYLSLAKQRKQKPNKSKILIKSLLAVLIIFLPVLVVHVFTCGIKEGCDTAEPASFTAYVVFFLLLNLITVTISSFVTIKFKSTN